MRSTYYEGTEIENDLLNFSIIYKQVVEKQLTLPANMMGNMGSTKGVLFIEKNIIIKIIYPFVLGISPAA